MIFHLFFQQYILRFFYLGRIGCFMICLLTPISFFLYPVFISVKECQQVTIREMPLTHTVTVTWFPRGVVFVFTSKLLSSHLPFATIIITLGNLNHLGTWIAQIQFFTWDTDIPGFLVSGWKLPSKILRNQKWWEIS